MNEILLTIKVTEKIEIIIIDPKIPRIILLTLKLKMK